MSDLALESTRRLAELLRREHAALGDFLVALADFDRQRLWEPLGHTGLFYFLHRELGLSKGAAHYRKVAAGLVQRFPEVVAPLRDGRLCITSVVELARVMTEANRAEVLPRFFHRSKAEARAVAVELRPETAPRREVVTLVHPGEPGGRGLRHPTPVAAPTSPPDSPPAQPSNLNLTAVQPRTLASTSTSTSTLASSPAPVSNPAPAPNRNPNPAAAPVPVPTSIAAPTSTPAPTSTSRPQVDPLTADLRRLHVTVSRRFLEKLDAARAALSHARPGAGVEEVLEAGLDLLLTRQAARRGQVKSPRQARAPRAPKRPEGRDLPPSATAQAPARVGIPAEVRREVWARDGGRCTWPLAGGGCCGATQRVEVDHIVPHALGGPTEPANLRLLCRFHNRLAARLAFGEAWKRRYRRRGKAGGSAGAAPASGPAAGPWAPDHLTTPAPAGPPPCAGG